MIKETKNNNIFAMTISVQNLVTSARWLRHGRRWIFQHNDAFKTCIYNQHTKNNVLPEGYDLTVEKTYNKIMEPKHITKINKEMVKPHKICIF